MAAPARQRILDAALALIQQQGIRRVTTKETASRAGAAEESVLGRVVPSLRIFDRGEFDYREVA